MLGERGVCGCVVFGDCCFKRSKGFGGSVCGVGGLGGVFKEAAGGFWDFGLWVLVEVGVWGGLGRVFGHFWVLGLWVWGLLFSLVEFCVLR